ncbi:MAG: VWA domain-containing protein [Candidatus Thiodiazotropha sp.]
MLADFHFLRPLWLVLIIPLLILIIRLLRAETGSDVWRGIVDANLLPHLLTDEHGKFDRLPLILLAICWLLGILALAGPVWQRLPQPVFQTQNYRVIVLDISASMNATDLAPSRLAHARFEVLDLLHKQQEGQTALLAYGAEPFVVSPLTSDTETITSQVSSLETSLLPVQGDKRTDLALKKAGELLEQAGAPDGEVILISDGLDHPAAAQEQARKLLSQNYSVSVLGVGREKGVPIPMANGGFLKDAGGAIIMSALESDSLKLLAKAGHGDYVTADLGDQDIEALIPSKITPLKKSITQQNNQADQWREQGPWLLLLLLPLAAFAFRRGWIGPLMVAILLAPPPEAQAFSWQDMWLRPDQQAAQAFEAGKHQQAAKLFDNPEWRAAAEYQAGDYQQALQSQHNSNSAQADYNQGNTLARLGRLKESITKYDQALKNNPQNEDARFNRELVKKLLDQKQQNQAEGQGNNNQENQQSQAKESSQKNQTGKENQQGANKQQNQQNSEAKKQQKQAAQQAQASQQKTPKKPAQQAQKKDTQTASEPATEKQRAENNKRRSENRDEQQQAAKETQPPADKSQSKEPGLADLLGDQSQQKSKRTTNQTAMTDTDLNNEDQQAMDQLLRRVEDDPAGLLRQRFLLQHLRRTGQLP